MPASAKHSQIMSKDWYAESCIPYVWHWVADSIRRPFGGLGMVSFMAKHIRSHREKSAIRAADDEAISLILHRSTVSLC